MTSSSGSVPNVASCFGEYSTTSQKPSMGATLENLGGSTSMGGAGVIRLGKSFG